MNIPSTRSASAPPCMRPNSTVPKTTSFRPDTRASTSAHARCIRLAALTPNARARSRTARATSGASTRRASSIAAAVALHVQQPERRRRLVDVPQQLAEERLVLLSAHPQPRLRHEVPERHRLRQLGSPRPARSAPLLRASAPASCDRSPGDAPAPAAATAHSPRPPPRTLAATALRARRFDTDADRTSA